MTSVLRLLFFCAVCLAPIGLVAQELKAPFVDEAEENEEFLAFRDALLAAVVERDIGTILTMTSDDILLSFGGAEGKDALREFLEVDPQRFAPEQRFEAPAMRERNWSDLETVLRLGGVFKTPDEFVAPYTWVFDAPEEMDPFEVMFITGSGVALRDRPIRFGQVIDRLTHDVVTFKNWVTGTSFVEIERADGTTGFVHRDFARFLLDYRALFEKVDGEWKLTTFVAGD